MKSIKRIYRTELIGLGTEFHPHNHFFPNGVTNVCDHSTLKLFFILLHNEQFILFVLQIICISNNFNFLFIMENQIVLNKNSKNKLECQQINYTDHTHYHIHHDDDNRIYKNTIKFNTAIPQVNKTKK